MSTISEILTEWADLTDMHGPKYIKDAPTKSLRYFWCGALFLSVSCMGAQFYQLLIIYIEEKTVTKVFYETVGLETEEMLQVVYCPAAWLNFSKAVESEIEWPVLIYAVHSMMTDFDQPNPVIKRIIEFHTGNSTTDNYFYIREFVKILQNSTELEKKFNDWMRENDLKTLMEFYEFFASKHTMESDEKIVVGHLIRYGRFCSINQPDGSSSRLNWVNDGINQFYFKFNHNRYDSPALEKFTDAIISFNPLVDYAAFNFYTLENEWFHDIPIPVIHVMFDKEYELNQYSIRIQHEVRIQRSHEPCVAVDPKAKMHDGGPAYECHLKCSEDLMYKPWLNCTVLKLHKPWLVEDFPPCNCMEQFLRPFERRLVDEDHFNVDRFFCDRWFSKNFPKEVKKVEKCKEECIRLKPCESWSFEVAPFLHDYFDGFLALLNRHEIPKQYFKVTSNPDPNPNSNFNFSSNFSSNSSSNRNSVLNLNPNPNSNPNPSNFSALGILLAPLTHSTLSEEKLMGTIEVLGGLGGSAGLFTGISLMSIVHILFCLSSIITVWCGGKKSVQMPKRSELQTFEGSEHQLNSFSRQKQ